MGSVSNLGKAAHLRAKGQVNSANHRIDIYGVFNPAGHCRYVGQTRGKADRFRCHLRNFGEDHTVRILSHAYSPEAATRLENEWMNLYRNAGHPLSNKARPIHCFPKYDEWPPTIREVVSGRTFVSVGHLCHHYRMRHNTVTYNFRNKLEADRTAVIYIPDVGGIRFELLDETIVPIVR